MTQQTALRLPSLQSLEVAYAREGDVPADNGWLSVRELEVLAALQIEKRRREWRLGRWTAKQAAARLFPQQYIEIIAAADGAPELFVDGVLTGHSISISHSHGLGMAVVSRTLMRIGCDIERIEPRTVEFIDSYLTPHEAELVHVAIESEKPLLANLIWSAKESVLKGARVGLRYDTRRVEIALARGAGWQPFWGQLDGACWRGVWRAQDGWVHTIARCAL